VFYPIGSSSATKSLEVKNVNISKITAVQNPACFKNSKGRTNITLEKAYGETLVNIK
jgi:hypothetical protein